MRRVLFLLVILVLTGCSQRIAASHIRAKFPKAEIALVPGCNYDWIVRDGDTVYCVHDDGSTAALQPEDMRVVVLFPDRTEK